MIVYCRAPVWDSTARRIPDRRVRVRVYAAFSNAALSNRTRDDSA